MENRFRFYSNNSLKNFSDIYVIGIVIGAALGSVIVYRNWPSYWLLAEGLIHMLILTIFGYRMKKRFEQVIAGSKIETAGYLHTIIGFFVAIALAGRGELNIDNLLSPIGSALLTSIIGWLFGGEITERGELSERKAKDEIVTVLNESSIQIKKMLENTEVQLGQLFTQLTVNQSQYHEESIKSIEDYRIKLAEQLAKIDVLIDTEAKKISGSFTSLTKVIEDSSVNLKGSLTNLKNTVDTNNQSWESTFTELNNLWETQAKNLNHSFNYLTTALNNGSSSIDTSFQQTNSIIISNNQALNNNLQATNNIIHTNFNSLQSINQSLTNFHNETNNTASLMKQVSSHCQNLSTSVKDTVNYLNTTKVLIQHNRGYWSYRWTTSK